jgi:hypothetical protein
MATKKRPPAPPAPRDEPAPAPAAEPTPNFLYVDETGVHLEAGEGEARTTYDLSIEQYNAILPLLLQRQKLGIEISAALAELGFTVSVAKTIDRPPRP